VLSRTVADDISCIPYLHKFRKSIVLVSYDVDEHYAFYLFSRNIFGSQVPPGSTTGASGAAERGSRAVRPGRRAASRPASRCARGTVRARGPRPGGTAASWVVVLLAQAPCCLALAASAGQGWGWSVPGHGLGAAVSAVGWLGSGVLLSRAIELGENRIRG